MPDLNVVAVLKAKAGSEAVLQEALAGLVAPTRAEDGCIGYELFRSASDASTFITIERWRSQDDLDAHMQTATSRRPCRAPGTQSTEGPRSMP